MERAKSFSASSLEANHPCLKSVFFCTEKNLRILVNRDFLTVGSGAFWSNRSND